MLIFLTKLIASGKFDLFNSFFVFTLTTFLFSNFAFDKNLYDNCPDWVSIQGFFQTEKYFKNIKDELQKDFEFKDEIKIPCEDMISSLNNPVALHIRRTDYITNPNHTCLGLDYYEKAIKEFDDQPILIFSDDPKWCQEQELFESDRFMISDNDDAYLDLCLMTMCKGHIIANSSFSWWGAWLADTNKVVAPIPPITWSFSLM